MPHSSVALHGLLASVIEVLANTAIAEICKVVDDGYAELRLEISQSQKEIDLLRRKLLVSKFQNPRRNLERYVALRRTVHVARGGTTEGAKSRNRSEYLSGSPSIRESNCATQDNYGPKAAVSTRKDQNLTTKTDSDVGRPKVPHTDKGEEDDENVPVILKVESLEDNSIDCNLNLDTPSSVNQHVERTMAAEGASSTPPSCLQARGIQPAGRMDSTNSIDTNGDITRAVLQHPNQRDNNSLHPVHPVTSQSVVSPRAVLRRGSEFESSGSCRGGASSNISTASYVETEHHTGPCPPHNPSPHGELQGGTQTKAPGRGNGRGGPPDPFGTLDWEPDVVLVDSVPIKVEADMSSEWTIIESEAPEGDVSSCRGQLLSRREDKSKRGTKLINLTDVYPPPTQRPFCEGDRIGLNGLSIVNHLSSSSSSSSVRSSSKALPHYMYEKDEPTSSTSSFSNTGLAKQPLLSPTSIHNSGSSGRQFPCNVCGNLFSRLTYLRRHERVHTGEKPYGCRHCSKRFSHNHQLKNHERVHTGEKPFRCPDCGRHFVQSCHMKRHRITHRADRAYS